MPHKPPLSSPAPTPALCSRWRQNTRSDKLPPTDGSARLEHQRTPRRSLATPTSAIPRPIYLQQMPFDLPRGHASGIQADDGLVKTFKSPLPLGHNLRFKTPVAIPGRCQFQIAKLPLERLRTGPVARVARVLARRIVFTIAQMH